MYFYGISMIIYASLQAKRRRAAAMQTCPSPHPASTNKSLGPTSARSKAFHLGARIDTERITVPTCRISPIILKPAAPMLTQLSLFSLMNPHLLHCLWGSPHERPNGPSCSLHGTWKLRSMDFTRPRMLWVTGWAKLVTKHKKNCVTAVRGLTVKS